MCLYNFIDMNFSLGKALVFGENWICYMPSFYYWILLCWKLKPRGVGYYHKCEILSRSWFVTDRYYCKTRKKFQTIFEIFSRINIHRKHCGYVASKNRLPLTCSVCDGLLKTNTLHFLFHIYWFVSADRILEM